MCGVEVGPMGIPAELGVDESSVHGLEHLPVDASNRHLEMQRFRVRQPSGRVIRSPRACFSKSSSGRLAWAHAWLGSTRSERTNTQTVGENAPLSIVPGRWTRTGSARSRAASAATLENVLRREQTSIALAAGDRMDPSIPGGNMVCTVGLVIVSSKSPLTCSPIRQFFVVIFTVQSCGCSLTGTLIAPFFDSIAVTAYPNTTMSLQSSAANGWNHVRRNTPKRGVGCTSSPSGPLANSSSPVPSMLV